MLSWSRYRYHIEDYIDNQKAKNPQMPYILSPCKVMWTCSAWQLPLFHTKKAMQLVKDANGIHTPRGKAVYNHEFIKTIVIFFLTLITNFIHSGKLLDYWSLLVITFYICTILTFLISPENVFHTHIRSSYARSRNSSGLHGFCLWLFNQPINFPTELSISFRIILLIEALPEDHKDHYTQSTLSLWIRITRPHNPYKTYPYI